MFDSLHVLLFVVVGLLLVALLFGDKIATRLRASGHPTAAHAVEEVEVAAHRLLPIALEAIHIASSNGSDPRATFALLAHQQDALELAHDTLERLTGKGLPGLLPSPSAGSGA